MRRRALLAVLAVFVSCSMLHVNAGSELLAAPRFHTSIIESDEDETSSTPSACPDGMVDVKGDYCPAALEICLHWVGIDDQPLPPPEPGKTGRCGEFQQPTKCRSSKVPMHYCIDRYEYPNVKGAIPQSWMSWRDAKAACESKGKRLCTEEEWTFACEGPDMKPYPYGDGYHRDKAACNFDNHMPSYPDGRKVTNVFKARHKGDETAQALESLLYPSGSNESCVSPFGVYDQVGNLDEEVRNTTCQPYCSGLKGGHVFGVRNACRPMTGKHNEGFVWYETGTRCCESVE